MSKVSVLVTRIFSLDAKIAKTIHELDRIIEKKLGDGWGITQQTDGLCLIDDNANNYALSMDELIRVLGLPKDEALEIIERHGI